MKNKQICEVSPYLMDGYLILSFEPKWLEIFGKIPTFSVSIDKLNRLVILGPEIGKPTSKINGGDNN